MALPDPGTRPVAPRALEKWLDQFHPACPHHYHYVSLLLLAEVVMDMHATVMRNNTSGGAGGAVSLSSEARLYASDCLFEGNTVYNNATGDDSGAGGALYADRMASVALVNITNPCQQPSRVWWSHACC